MFRSHIVQFDLSELSSSFCYFQWVSLTCFATSYSIQAKTKFRHLFYKEHTPRTASNSPANIVFVMNAHKNNKLGMSLEKIHSHRGAHSKDTNRCRMCIGLASVDRQECSFRYFFLDVFPQNRQIQIRINSKSLQSGRKPSNTFCSPSTCQLGEIVRMVELSGG